MRIELKADLSGTIHSRSLVAEGVVGRFASGSEGVDWENHAQVTFGRGKFASISALRLEEIHFDISDSGSGIKVMTVTLPRGPEVRWAAALTSSKPELRENAGPTVDPGSTAAVGERIELAIEFPSYVISQGVRLHARGVDGSHERNVATLIVTADASQVQGDDLIWIITW